MPLSPAGESPAEESPAGESPAGEPPAGEPPAGESHAEESFPDEPTPVDAVPDPRLVVARPDAAHAAIARATAREVAVHEAYDRARNVLRARERRRALTPLARERFSTPGTLDAYAARSMPSWAWGVPLSRRGHLLAVISPTASAITPQIKTALGPTVIVVASWDEQERIRAVTESRQRFDLLSVRVPEPTHEEIVDFARRHPVASTWF
ncbi:hypothetical protein MWU75_17555 [Ornithinimicrobium sp. F0845]|uniref:hypothetical protein n=1 Tax=Ornithinimicrobium sp. F0845 TaxID=2926412 RepID=UPI001FF24D62|nr:hypothetical protein [Ornithinimicrobium sp. F0845]MCK0113951.1 hypothetical protein [Ornithinimicrobium sp. F0845]